MKKTNCALPMLEKLAEEGNWDQVFYCLGIDPNGFFELSKVSDDSWNKFDWLREHQETMKMLTTALHVIQLFNKILFCVCMFYALSFVYKWICHKIFARKRGFEIEDPEILP